MRSFDLVATARRILADNHFFPDFSPAALAQADHAVAPDRDGARDLRHLLWSSIDNHESKDLDQVEVAEALSDGTVRVLVGIADVDGIVSRGTPIDVHAADVTVSLYTGAVVFPMLPRTLSEGLTSLGEAQDRLAIVTELVIDASGHVVREDVFQAWLHNHAKLAYDDVAAWLDGGTPPRQVAENAELAEQLRLQHRVGQALKCLRHERGALELDTIEARTVVVDGEARSVRVFRKNAAREIIEDFMIAANGAMARFLENRGLSSIRRVVEAPERWPRIVAIAAKTGDTLPSEPDAVALAAFLAGRRAADPEGFGDLSLSVVKLMGPGIYAVDRPGHPSAGHFGLAVTDYTHSTAPNRRFADLVIQRLVKATLHGRPPPYTDDELAAVAARCTLRENDARKVERTMRKVVAAVMLHDRVGERFAAIVTGSSPKGTYVRLLDPPAEGRVVRGDAGMDVGERVTVQLLATDPNRGFIDFAGVHPS
jgi:VacB/RNase II family 3'-5' exoribonuclease